MEQNLSLQNILLNVMYELTSPKNDKLQPHHMVGILSLTNLLGIVNYMNLYAPVALEHQAAVSGNSNGGGNEMLNSLLQMMAGGKKGSGSNMPDMNPQSLLMLLNLMSSMGQKGRSDPDSEEHVREVGS
jgi:hypothetical protein